MYPAWMPKDSSKDQTTPADASPSARLVPSGSAAPDFDFEPPKVQLDLQSVDLEVSLAEGAPEGLLDLEPRSVGPEGKSDCLLRNAGASRPAEEGVAASVVRTPQERWLADNQDALASSNAFVERHGLPLSDYGRTVPAVGRRDD